LRLSRLSLRLPTGLLSPAEKKLDGSAYALAAGKLLHAKLNILLGLGLM
jgi:hypothetical protein